jgi:histone deacetylase 6
VINFVDGDLRPVKSDVDESLSVWYKTNSRVFVTHDHLCWSDPELTRKVSRRRFGDVIRSPVSGVSHMLHEHASEVQNWILTRQREGHGDTTEEDQDRAL